MNTLTTKSPLRETDDWVLMPWSPMREIQNRMEQLFNHWPERETMMTAEWSPAVDVAEDDKEFILKAELPEVNRSDIKVTVQNSTLSISGERKSQKEEKGRRFRRIERSFGRFERSFTLPEAIKADKIRSEFKDGILTVHVPKSHEGKTAVTEIPVK